MVSDSVLFPAANFSYKLYANYNMCTILMCPSFSNFH